MARLNMQFMGTLSNENHIFREAQLFVRELTAQTKEKISRFSSDIVPIHKPKGKRAGAKQNPQLIEGCCLSSRILLELRVCTGNAQEHKGGTCTTL